jgi:drug/metabolite transporter (DMT)-like permease
MSERQKGFLFALASAFLYGLVPVLGKIAVSDFHPIFVAFVVTLASSFYLGIGFFFYKKKLSFSKRQVHWVLLIGLFSTVGSVAGFSGLLFGKANEAGFLFQFEIFFVAILANFFLKEKLYKHQYVGLIFMLIGAGIFSHLEIKSVGFGSILFLTAALAWGISDIIARGKASRITHPLYIALGRSIFSSVFLLPLVILFARDIPGVSAGNLYYFLLYGVIVAGIFFFLYLSLKYTKATNTISFYILSPIIASLGSFIFLGEYLSFQQIIGGGIILVSIILVLREKLVVFKK